MSSAAQHLSPAPALDAFTLSFFDTKRYPMDAASAESYRRHYAEHHYVKFPGLLLGPGFPLLQQEVFRLRECAFRRQFNMECMDNSPRHMSTLGGDGIQELSTLVPRLYEHPALLRFLTYVADVEVQTLPDIDRYVINDLHQSGDTFGAHYDDYPISLVFIIEGAPAGAGGDVEMVKNGALADIDGPRVTRLPLATGDVYMLKSDTTAHRVAPLTADVRRTAINLAYITEGFVVANPTESASLLYKKGYKRRED